MNIKIFAVAALFAALPATAFTQSSSDEALPKAELGSPEAVAIHAKGYAAMERSDVDEGARLYSQACELGHAEACGSMGALHLSGTGVEKDALKAIKYMEKACGITDALSCTFGGSLFAVSEVYPKAHELLNKGCALNEGDSCAELGTLHWQGLGTAESIPLARTNFAKSCDLESAEGCYSSAALMINEDGPKAYAMADIFLKKALALDPEHAEALAAREALKEYLE